MKPVFEKAGIVVTDSNKKEVDRPIHETMGIRYKDCPPTWKGVKKRNDADEDAFAAELRERIKKK